MKKHSAPPASVTVILFIHKQLKVLPIPEKGSIQCDYNISKGTAIQKFFLMLQNNEIPHDTAWLDVFLENSRGPECDGALKAERTGRM